ncbi:MAG: hypothetical protein QOJ42_3176, partial [Acidobacteriaceae bacterium]|nr:hypothetical protein [Acidobacteriaceae bacterium]
PFNSLSCLHQSHRKDGNYSLAEEAIRAGLRDSGL